MAAQLKLAEEHRNHFLFSDYYLDHRVPERAEWRTAGVRATFEQIAGLWGQFKPQQDNEAQTEDKWIRPVLHALGHAFDVQVAIKTPLGTRVPHYILYPSGLHAVRPDGGRDQDYRGEHEVPVWGGVDSNVWGRGLSRDSRSGKGVPKPAEAQCP